MADINWKNKCWVTTIYLVLEDKRVLLTWNGRLNTWIPVGGHIDPGENPDDAIKREIEEELPSFEFEFVPHPHIEDNGKVKIIKPYRIQIEKVPHHNTHLNLIFFGRCLKHTKIDENDEGDKLRWFSKEELEKEDMLDNVKKLALKAIELVLENKNNSRFQST